MVVRGNYKKKKNGPKMVNVSSFPKEKDQMHGYVLSKGKILYQTKIGNTQKNSFKARILLFGETPT